MHIEKIVCSLEQTLFFKEQNLTIPSYFKRWKGRLEDNKDTIIVDPGLDEMFWENIGPAYISPELAEVLPGLIQYEEYCYFLKIIKGNNGWSLWYETNTEGIAVSEEGFQIIKKTLFNTTRRNYNLSMVMAEYLLLLIKEKLITV